MTLKSATTDPQTQALAAAWAQAREACRAVDVEIHEVHDPTGGRSVVDLLNRIWGATELDIMDVAFLIALVNSGNLIAEARRHGEPVGAAVGFCGPPGTPFHSHIVGVVPEAVGQGVGRAVKLHQRAWCLTNGIETMSWTFDPLVARNAFFNIRRLGAMPHEYHPDFYGHMTDGINAGQRSDRIVVVWDLAQTPPDRSYDAEPDTAGAVIAVDNAGGRPGAYQPPADQGAETVLLGLPRDIEAIRRTDPDLAQQWRSVTRQAFTDLFTRGWFVRGFTRTGFYLLQHPERTP